MMWDMVKKGLGRAFLAAAAGWGVYFFVSLSSIMTTASTPAEAIWAALHFNDASVGLILGLSGI